MYICIYVYIPYPNFAEKDSRSWRTDALPSAADLRALPTGWEGFRRGCLGLWGLGV